MWSALCHDGGSDGEQISVAYSGVWDVNVSGITNSGYMIHTSDVSGVARSSITGVHGTFAMAMTTKDVGTALLKCQLTPVERY